MRGSLAIQIRMGRWAQARRRASLLPTQPALGPPPAPVLAVVGSDVVQTAQGADDLDGSVRLEYSEGEEIPFQEWDNHQWNRVHNWGPAENFGGYRLRAIQVGGGSAYVGESEPSNILDFL